MRKTALLAGLFVFLALATAASPVSRVDVNFSPNGGCRDAVVGQIRSAQSRILVAIYTLTDDSIASALAAARSRGIEVKVLMDKGQAAGGYAKGGFLDSSGVQVEYATGGGLMHNKYALIDTSVVVTGSFNWTWSAESKNAEYLRVIQSPEIYRSYAASLSTLGSSGTMIRKSEPTRRMAGNFVSNSKSEKFHRADCIWTKKMSPANQVWFDTKDDAIRTGYGACNVSKP